MSVANRLSLDAYLDLALRDPDGFWELWDGEPREKPFVSWEHGDQMFELGRVVANQLDRDQYRVRVGHGRILWGDGRSFIPDVCVLPTSYGEGLRGHPDRLEAYRGPLPLVVEIWSPSTGGYDRAVKLRTYQERGDAEIWLLHPVARTLTRWLRRPDGTYREETATGGTVELAAIPGVTVDLDALFAL
jgi:Uma2 family endonuclease